MNFKKREMHNKRNKNDKKKLENSVLKQKRK